MAGIISRKKQKNLIIIIKSNISAKELNLAKFFITANIPIKACQNKYLRAHSGDAVGKYALQQTILPKLKNELQ